MEQLIEAQQQLRQKVDMFVIDYVTAHHIFFILQSYLLYTSGRTAEVK